MLESRRGFWPDKTFLMTFSLSSRPHEPNGNNGMRTKRRGETALIIEILETAKKGATISTLSRINSFAGVNRYLPRLLENRLLRVEKSPKYLISVDGREYGLLYFTTAKGLELLKRCVDLLVLLGEKGDNCDGRL